MTELEMRVEKLENDIKTIKDALSLITTIMVALDKRLKGGI